MRNNISFNIKKYTEQLDSRMDSIENETSLVLELSQNQGGPS